ncbi:Two-component response regulator, FixJ family, consists of REC and HTH domains [Ralstonia sp. 25mfcol4.1]|uniref:response regulator transcription factor n=1 Tax=Ralstonia sp. 25mfcol4.1 TaxID=1761899 RepID=UPI00087E57A6|nr:LuxR C-terminal-related transcriptional regulator [Ralstonia sp. 25mfcol4.1]SDP82521.1 Two-component response regulator, FixJ family, consists of REC and HTH domains [Ralstonia sp. 25mfcol4.1]
MTGTVFVVDGDESIRKALCRLLQVKGFTSRPFCSAEEFRPDLDTLCRPTCVVADLILPGISGLELLKLLPAHVPFIMLTSSTNVEQAVETMKAGAVNILENPVAEDRLVMAVTTALELATQRSIERAMREALESRMKRLTNREREVMAMVTTGLRNKEIANILGIVEKTVKVHRASIMSKLEVDSLAHLVRCADKLGIKYTSSAPRRLTATCASSRSQESATD